MKCKGSFARLAARILEDSAEIMCLVCGESYRVEIPAPGMLATVPDHERPCDIEFGEHEHDDEECARILDVMSGDSLRDYEDSLARAYNREAEENMLGRPLFPNEY